MIPEYNDEQTVQFLPLGTLNVVWETGIHLIQTILTSPNKCLV